ncbi:RNA polymerase sigma factor [Tautonia rosea]|uniref:RNA polymerase sigma factor n=1 Tax=Tautonia rosea TaxID=2728037 RepID=UPI0014756FBC|nr:RNA polymerase sigma factor [Tautonia rosea]
MEEPIEPGRLAMPGDPTPDSHRLEAEVVAQLFDVHGPEVYRLLLGILRDPHQAQDALQATFLKTLERGHHASSETFRGWLFRVAAREALALRRDHDRRRRHQQGLGWLRKALDVNPNATDDPLVRSEQIEAVRAAIGELAPLDRAIIRSRMFEDKTFAQIAEDHHLPLGTVLTRMRRALKRLSQQLHDEDEP